MLPLLSLLVRSGAILLGAEILRRCLRRSPAAQKHGLLLFAFGLLIAWPLLSGILPSIPVFWPAPAAQGEIEIRQTFRTVASVSRSHVLIYIPVAIWLAGVFVTVGPLLYGLIRLRRLRQQARLLAGAPLNELLAQSCSSLGLARVPELLLMPGTIMPMTFGVRRPNIVLPEECLAWSRPRTLAVLMHELAHIQRRDVASQLFAHLTTALWWFQPFSWVIRRSLRQESERACDEMVVQCGVRASDYAAELLAIAKDFRAPAPIAAAGISMARCGDLAGRLHLILAPQPISKPAGARTFAAALVCVSVLTIAASALTLSSLPIAFPQSESPQRSSPMFTVRRTVLSGLLASAGLSAATIGGSLFDANGTPVSNAKASILNADTAAKLEATTSTDGKFVFESLPAGQYILRIEKPGFPALYREFKVQEDSKVDRGMMLGDTTQHPASKPDQVRVPGAEQQAKLITKVTPVYPTSAKEARIQGMVVLDATLSADGVPEDVRVVSSPSDDLSQSALDAVRQWRYTPTLLNGEPISVVTEIHVNYTLSK
jgi:TonB family protein